MNFDGRVHVIPDNVDTDQILPGEYLHIDRSSFGDHVLEGYDETYPDHVEEGDILVAGTNLGLGSSREAAPMALQQAGIAAVVAESFARIFYRNCINIGLPIAQADNVTEIFTDGDEATVNLETGVVKNESTGKTLETSPLPSELQEILESGGLVD